MLLELYNLNHTRIAGLKNHKDARVESELSTGDKTLSFYWHKNNKQKIPQEYYIRTTSDEYVVKENSNGSNGYRKIVAKLNLEAIEGRAWKEFTIAGCTAKNAADYALTDTGWTCISTVQDDRVRNISLKKISSYQIFEKILEAFTCEVEWDTINKVVYLKETVGADRGAYFMEGINLKELTENSDTYDYATIIVPIGMDDLGIEDVNGGNNFLENYQYSTKKKTIIWEDTSYTDAQALKEDAAYKLNEISKPKRSFQAKTIDLAKLKPEYSALAYSVGDTLMVISNKEGVKEKQRITKTVEYLENPEKNTCDISNTVLSFEEMQKKMFAAADAIGNITTDNGTVNGSKVDSIDVTQIIGLDRYISEDMDDLKVTNLYVRTEFGTPYAVIGQAILTQLQTANFIVTAREDVELSYIKVLYASQIHGETAVFKTVEAENISALAARVDAFSTESLDAHYAQIDYANVNTAVIRQGFLESLMVSQGIIADRVVGTEVVATKVLTGVNIFADDISAGTLSVDRLVIRGTEHSLIYELNNISGALQSVNVNTLNGEVMTPRSISADRIVASSITANEINVTNLRSSGFIGANKLTATNIDVANLFAQNIVASGSIRSRNYVAGSTGMKLTMSTGEWDSKYFKIASNGSITAQNALFIDGIYATYYTAGAFGTEGVKRTIYFSQTGMESALTDVIINVETGFNGLARIGLLKGSSYIANNFENYNYFRGDWFQVDGYAIFKKTIELLGGLYVHSDILCSNLGATTISTERIVNSGQYTQKYDGHAYTDNVSAWGHELNFKDKNGTRVAYFNMLYQTNSTADLCVGADHGKICFNSNVSINGYCPGYALNTPSFICQSWVRTQGNAGWYSETYGGGIWMVDSTWIRTFGGKNFYCDSTMGAAYLYSDGAFRATGSISCSDYGYFVSNKSTMLVRVQNNNNSADLRVTNSAGVYHDGGAGGSGTSKWLVYINTSGTVVANTSDRRQKNYLGDTTEKEALTVLKSVPIINFMYKEDVGVNNVVQNGVFAQDVRDVLISSGIGYRPYLIIEPTDNEDDGIIYDINTPETNRIQYSIDYSKIVPLLWKGWQYHDDKFTEMERKTKLMQNQIENLQFELQQAKFEIEQLKQAVA